MLKKWRLNRIATLNAASSIIDTSRGSVEYSDWDEGIPLFAVHGAPGGCDQNFYIFNGMRNKGFRLVSWSRPGYLRTSLDVGKTFEEQADAMAALMDALNIEKAGIDAFSSGGPCAICFAAKYPRRVSALFLEGCVAKSFSMFADEFIEKKLEEFAFSDTGNWLLEKVKQMAPKLVLSNLVKLYGKFENKALFKKMVNEIYENKSKLQCMFDLVDTASPFSLRKDGFNNDEFYQSKHFTLPLEEVKAPTLIFHGDCDGDVDLTHSDLLHSGIKGSELAVIEDSIHMLSLSRHADNVAIMKMDFLRKHAE